MAKGGVVRAEQIKLKEGMDEEAVAGAGFLVYISAQLVEQGFVFFDININNLF